MGKNNEKYRGWKITRIKDGTAKARRNGITLRAGNVEELKTIIDRRKENTKE